MINCLLKIAGLQLDRVRAQSGQHLETTVRRLTALKKKLLLGRYPLNISKPISNTGVRQNFFSSRVIDSWNNLPASTKRANSLEVFKDLMKFCAKTRAYRLLHSYGKEVRTRDVI